MELVRVQVMNEVGLHARPAALFVAAAKRFSAKVRVRNATTGSKWVDAKSILSLLTLGVDKDHEIEVTAEGPDEAAAVMAIGDLVRGNFAPA